jgi:kinesin family protein C2/C3
LAESSAANAALSSQLESMAPQLSQLESALTHTKLQLETSQSQLRHAENKAEECESRLREVEASLVTLRDDADAAHEELAFKESELEEALLELEVERERFRVELQDLQVDLQLRGTPTSGASGATTADQSLNGHGTLQSDRGGLDEDGFLPADKEDEDTDYVKRLEDELELVTEQLIDTEQRLTTAEDLIVVLKQASLDHDSKHAAAVQQADELEKMRDDHDATLLVFQKTKDELELVQEELQLTQEELKAAEEDLAIQKKQMETLVEKSILDDVQRRLEESQGEARTSANALREMEQALTRTMTDSEQQARQVESLEKALENSKKDVQSLQADLERLEEKFDAATKEAEKAGRDAGREEGTEETKKVLAQRIDELEKELAMLRQSNTSLQQKLDEAEVTAAKMASAQAAGLSAQAAAGDVAQNETIQKIQDQLTRARDAERKKSEEVQELQLIVQNRVAKAEEDVARLEKELSVTKGKLYEAEAHLIVSSKKQSKSAAMAAAAAAAASTVQEGDASQTGLDDKRARSTSPDTPHRLKALISEEQAKVAALQKELDEMRDQARMEEKHKKHLEDELKTLQKQLFSGGAPVVQQMSRLSQLGNASQGNAFGDDELSQVEEIIKSNKQDDMVAALRALDSKSNMQREYNAQLLSKILSLQGNIQVCCRIRPLRVSEIESGAKNNVEAFSETELGCFDNRQSKWKPFAFDKVWGPDQTQRNIFRDVEPLALSVVDGFNACIFAYGQTGSGKTYTMEGTAENNQYGISYRTIQKIFNLLNLRAQQQKAASNLSGEAKAFSFKLRLGMLEIYNDEIYDLLAAHSTAGSSKADQKREAKKAGVKATLDIKRSADGRIEVPGLLKEPVNSIDDVMSLLSRGNASRATAATNLNEHSSRSHMVLLVDVQSGLEGEPSNNGILYLVDLAGSERVRNSQVEGEQLKEATHINKSLSALGNVMEALDRKASHIPYRDSKLTYLLQDAVGGNSRTMMVVAVCPTDVSHDESVHALQFATRVRRIQIGAAQRNVTSKNLEETVKALAAELKALSKAKENSESQLNILKKDNARIQERLQAISLQRSKATAESSTVELLRKSNTDTNARLAKEKELREKVAEELEKSKAELRKKQVEFSKLTREKEALVRKMEEHEITLEKAVKEARTAKDASSAANLRARKAQIIGSRHSTPRPPVSASSTPVKVSTPDISVTSRAAATKATNAAVDLGRIRKEVMELLEKYDKEKLDRIDIIMEKFKGKEELLVDKMKQRYESGAAAAGGIANLNLQRRSEMALQRHKDRMQKKLEQQQQQKEALGN